MKKEILYSHSKDIAFWIMIITIIILSLYVYGYIKEESFKCMSSPLVYGVSKYDTNTDFSCTCSSFGADRFLYVTKDNATMIINRINYIPQINYSISTIK